MPSILTWTTAVQLASIIFVHCLKNSVHLTGHIECKTFT